MMRGEDQFVFLNEKHSIQDASDWNNSDWSKLWLYNLHYFDDLNADASNERVAWHETYLNRWIAENPIMTGNGWEPYPCSLRITNWIKWALSGNELDEHQHRSLAAQARHLEKNMEWHILGNHLFANAKALVFAGLFYTGGEAERWFQKGINLVERELKAQVLSDGGHFELSPMYHHIILEDLLDIINLLRVFGEQVPSAVEQVVPGMVRWSSVMVHPDGEVSFFNDAAMGIALTARQLGIYAEKLGFSRQTDKFEPVEYLKDSGYIRMENTSSVVFLDVARVGPDYLPGHAHADTLSFELSLYGQRVVVNSGTSQYGSDTERIRQRSTAAHSTVVVDRFDSSEVWGGFRVARRATPRVVRVLSEKERCVVEAMHDGYRRFSSIGDHHREWELNKHSLKIFDRIEGRGLHHVEIFFHFHPALSLTQVSADRVAVQDKGGQFLAEIRNDSKLTMRIEDGTYHPEFGKSLQNRVLIYSGDVKLPFSTTSMIFFREHREE